MGEWNAQFLRRLRDEKLAAEAMKDEVEINFCVSVHENLTLKNVIKELECKVNIYKRVLIGLGMIGLAVGVLMYYLQVDMM